MATQTRSAAAPQKEKEKLHLEGDAATHEDPTITDDPTFEENAEAETKLLRKIDMCLLPTIWLVYLLSYMVSQFMHHCALLSREADNVCRTDPTSGMLE